MSDYIKMGEEKGFLYVFSNESMPGLFKVGMTTRNIQERLREANKHDTFKPPLPYKFEFGVCVNGPPREKETILHTLLSKYGERTGEKTNPRSEFFRIPLEELKLFFKLIDPGSGLIYPCKTLDNDEKVKKVKKVKKLKKLKKK